MRAPKKIAKLQDWIIKNESDWKTICGQGDFPITESEYMRIHHVLMENDFEEITLVLLTTHFYAVETRLKQNLKPLVDILLEELRKKDLPKDAGN